MAGNSSGTSAPNQDDSEQSEQKNEVIVVSGTIRIRRGELFLADEIRAALGVGRDTIQRWLDDGLPCSQPWTRGQIFSGDDILDFMARHAKVRPKS